MKHTICLLVAGLALAALPIAMWASKENQSPPGQVCTAPGDRMPCDVGGWNVATYRMIAAPEAPLVFDLPAPGAAVELTPEPFFFTVLPLRGEAAVPRYPLRL